jgi:hypothetical protein
LMCSEVRRVAENDVSALIATSLLMDPFIASRDAWSLGVLYCVRKLRSQTASNARPCAMLARRATVHGVLASMSLSKVSMSSGLR